MKKQYILDQNDITKIVAEKFGVPIGDVEVSIKKKSVGYGPMEHDINVVEMKVSFDEEVKE